MNKQCSSAGASDLHEEACEERSLNAYGIAPGAEGGHRDGQLDPLQGVCELRTQCVGHQKSCVAQVEILTPLLLIAVCWRQIRETKSEIKTGNEQQILILTIPLLNHCQLLLPKVMMVLSFPCR